MNDENTAGVSAENADLSQAKEALALLPVLGPAIWLCARDPMRKYRFMADIDWMLLPPVVLDQCRLYTKADVPFAFVTWAYVSDAIDARLRSNEPKIAPHEWQSGSNAWLIDVVAPFGQVEGTLDELREAVFSGKKLSALLPDAERPGRLGVKEWGAETSA